MNLLRYLPFAAAVGCVPAISDKPIMDAEDSGSAGSLESADDGDQTAPNGPNPDLVRPGPWRTVEARIQGDPCSFNEYLTSGNINYPVELYLPQQFEVQRESGGFYIEAAGNTARGPIYCALQGDQFDCESQQVILYEDWQFDIEFSGVQVDAETITGTAVVQFTFDAETEALITSYGFDMAQCDHTVDMTLGFGRF